MAIGLGHGGDIEISLPGASNPSYPVSVDGKIEAHGTWTNGFLSKIEGAVVQGFLDPATLPDPGDIAHRVEGFVDSDGTWHFEIVSGDDRRARGAHGYCEQNTFIAWGTFSNGGVDTKCQPFIGQDGSGSCSSSAGRGENPIFAMAPTNYLIEFYDDQNLSHAGDQLKLALNDVWLTHVSSSSSFEHPVWEFRYPPYYRVNGSFVQGYVRLEVFREGGRTVGVVTCEVTMDRVYRSTWRCREWSFDLKRDGHGNPTQWNRMESKTTGIGRIPRMNISATQ